MLTAWSGRARSCTNPRGSSDHSRCDCCSCGVSLEGFLKIDKPLSTLARKKKEWKRIQIHNFINRKVWILLHVLGGKFLNISIIYRFMSANLKFYMKWALHMPNIKSNISLREGRRPKHINKHRIKCKRNKIFNTQMTSGQMILQVSSIRLPKTKYFLSILRDKAFPE